MFWMSDNWNALYSYELAIIMIKKECRTNNEMDCIYEYNEDENGLYHKTGRKVLVDQFGPYYDNSKQMIAS
jgi:hypothetical protein